MSALRDTWVPAAGKSSTRGLLWLLLGVLTLAAPALRAQGKTSPGWQEFSPGVAYRNDKVGDIPWSIHIGRVDRSQADITFQSIHARGKALGLATLSAMVRHAESEFGSPLVGVNGDFYQMRGRPFAGDVRGLQIMGGELLSGPTDGISFWIDATGQPRIAHVESGLKVTWPDGTQTAFGVNDQFRTSLVLYTPSAGPSTGTTLDSMEIVLERSGSSAWLPLKVGENYQARIMSIQQGRNTRIGSGQMVLSVPADLKNTIPKLEPGNLLRLSTTTIPDLKGIDSAISGGPILVHEGKWQPLPGMASGKIGYGERSKYERHPRSALGWNDNYFFLVEVDGRQQGLSVGMTLEELGNYMLKLGCKEVMNLDGGGSAMFWANGRIQNSPCDGGEREVANALIVVRKNKKKAEVSSASLVSP